MKFLPLSSYLASAALALTLSLPVQAAVVFDASFGSDFVNPVTGPANLNSVTATGTWSDFSGTASLSTFALVDNAASTDAYLAMDQSAGVAAGTSASLRANLTAPVGFTDGGSAAISFDLGRMRTTGGAGNDTDKNVFVTGFDSDGTLIFGLNWGGRGDLYHFESGTYSDVTATDEWGATGGTNSINSQLSEGSYNPAADGWVSFTITLENGQVVYSVDGGDTSGAFATGSTNPLSYLVIGTGNDNQTINFGGGYDNLLVDGTVIPEPSSGALIAVGSGLLLLLRRRRG
ncbi:MAG: PEP-CTERM sorting domain-containing protein [Verrucomicrobiota bacterium]